MITPAMIRVSKSKNTYKIQKKNAEFFKVYMEFFAF